MDVDQILAANETQHHALVVNLVTLLAAQDVSPETRTVIAQLRTNYQARLDIRESQKEGIK